MRRLRRRAPGDARRAASAARSSPPTPPRRRTATRRSWCAAASTEPAGFDLTASCESVDGVGYYIPDEQYDDQELDLTLTAAGYRPRVEVVVPADYRPNAAPAAMAVLAPLVKEHLTLADDCG